MIRNALARDADDTDPMHRGVSFLKSSEPRIREAVAGAIGRPARRVHLAMRPDKNIATVDLPTALAKVTDQFFATIELSLGGLVVIEIAHETNAERDIVQIIAVDMTAINLVPPAITHFDLSISGGGPVSDDEVVGQSVPHSTDMPMIIVEHTGISLSRSTIVNNNELPPPALDRSPTDLLDHRSRQVTV